MSSFKRKSASKQPSLAPGTRLSPSSPSTIITSTGIPSLDDILGGGLPSSCSFITLAPDSHSAYGELVQKYFIAQGLATGQKICVIDDDAELLLRECMWMPGSPSAHTSLTVAEDEDNEKTTDSGDKIKIAWRYEQMKKFQTTITSNSMPSEDFCSPLDLTCRIPQPTLDLAKGSEQVLTYPVSSEDDEKSTRGAIRNIRKVLDTIEGPSSRPLRICIPSLGSPQWGDMEPQDILLFLYRLRALLRQHPTTCASLSLAPHLCTDEWGGTGWIQKVGCDKYSVLRGLSSSASATGGSGENNLAFKCTRRRLVFETLHLDLEGGVSERRTAPPTEGTALDGPAAHTSLETFTSNPKQALATIQVELEAVKSSAGGDVGAVDSLETTERVVAPPTKGKKPKKKVAFHSERPDLYDF
ncbi:hypothetical protein SERLA73DRAFT_171391 [Serpula lacrymans var. lacrymans S7.3]|uniref:Elongator complex protein 4 n=2 Tax=Serpula lacrymans var. lacrymans TaxID=341189 RepID=F8QB05_SERL3|nr:uncharacterized protein SERLADRAFT_453194 [Serpula lacrymans var. lacrymans S7.9]EGN94391.1 hypothetical protein SERLA73DRAFT_171391 [Serpula lacrymans var. lacrymans S7.3]EGO19874.1 hypothetical protein SERLADRAFT_453194 [Serpula lacrymans var. lacrymans S7.9]